MRGFLLLLACPLFASNCTNAYTGTVSVTANSATAAWVSGSMFITGSAWVRYQINVGYQQYLISSVQSTTSLTLGANSPVTGAYPYSVSTCPVEPGGTAGSTTWAPIPNSSYTSQLGTSIASTDTLYSIPYDTTASCPTTHATDFNPGNCIMEVFLPHGFSTSDLFWILCIHGGAGSAGRSAGCFGGANEALDSTLTPIQLIQQYLDSPNPVGGKGIGIIQIEYPLSRSPGVAAFPAQFQSVACAEAAIMGGILGFTPTAPLGLYGASWGGELTFWLGNVPTSTYGALSTCKYPDRRASSHRTVSAWPAMTWCQPHGPNGTSDASASSWGNNSSGVAITAYQDALNVTTYAQCYAADTKLNASPYLQINSGSLALIHTNAQMFQWTSTDQIVTPFWGTNNSQGHASYTIDAYQALGVTPQVIVYPNCGTLYQYCNSSGGHESGLGNIGVWAMGDAMNFLLTPGASASQAITFSSLPNVAVGVAPFAITATASSGLTVSFVSSTPTVCTVAGTTVTIVGGGLCTIIATQAGNTTFYAATPVTQIFAALAPGGGATIKSGGIVPVYSTVATIQPGEWVSIYGTKLAGSTATWNGDFPTSLGGTSVTIDGKPAYLSFVSPGQINLQAPDDTATGTVVPVVVVSANNSAASTVALARFAPSFALLDAKHVAGIILRSNGLGAYGGGTYDFLGPTGSSLGYPTVAAKPGDTVELFGVGFGPTTPAVPAGQVLSAGPAPVTTNPVQLSIGGTTVLPSFSGLSEAGLYQFNLTIPAGLGTGDLPLVAFVGGDQTQSGVFISLQ